MAPSPSCPDERAIPRAATVGNAEFVVKRAQAPARQRISRPATSVLHAGNNRRLGSHLEVSMPAASGINTGDTAWLLISTALVMLMTPGLALFYGGMVQRKNVLSTFMHCFFALGIVTVQWAVVGY